MRHFQLSQRAECSPGAERIGNEVFIQHSDRVDGYNKVRPVPRLTHVTHTSHTRELLTITPRVGDVAGKQELPTRDLLASVALPGPLGLRSRWLALTRSAPPLRGYTHGPCVQDSHGDCFSSVTPPTAVLEPCSDATLSLEACGVRPWHTAHPLPLTTSPKSILISKCDLVLIHTGKAPLFMTCSPIRVTLRRRQGTIFKNRN